MNKEEYKKIVKQKTPKEDKHKNAFIAFITGGLVGALAEGAVSILIHCFAFSRSEACLWVCIGVIFVSCILTAMGFFDNLVNKAKAGLILPTTGFAHSVTSAALDYKRDGFITGIGANFFKLAGSVIIYGIISAFIFAMIGVVFYA